MVVLAAPAFAQDFAGTKVALVLANAKYAGSAQLANAERDGVLIADTLRALGFAVELQTNLQRKDMRAALDRFVASARTAQTALVYYAGHGAQVKGLNYLVPINPEQPFPANEKEIELQSLGANELIDKLGTAAGRTNIVILDACRDNPYSTSYRSLGPARAPGLAPMDAPVGTLIAYSTSPGKKARDGGAGGHSVYSAALAQEMRKPGQSIEQTFKAVRATVLRATQGEQITWESTSLVGNFSFGPAAGTVATASLAPAANLPWNNPGADRAASAAMATNGPDARLEALRQQAAALDLSASVPDLRRQAGAGMNDAQVLLGFVLADPRNPTAAPPEARTWWQAAASRGDVAAQVLLAESLLDQRHPSDSDRARAARLLNAAADAGSARAAARVGR